MKTIKELQAVVREKHDNLAEIDNKLNAFDITIQSRELNDSEKKEQNTTLAKRDIAYREYQAAQRDLSEAMSAAQAAGLTKEPEKSASVRFRELLKGVRSGKQSREVILGADDGTGIAASGAVNLSIEDIIPTLNEGLGLPQGLRMTTGVIGNEVWPVSADDVKITEKGEVEALEKQDLNFDKITVTPKRAGLLVRVSNTAIDNAAFDVLAFVQQKLSLALSKYIAEKLYSQAAWDGNKGPFSGLASSGTITLDDTAYKGLLKAVAGFIDKGYDAANVCFVIDATTEADLKGTPKAAGQGGFIIEDGKLAGYNYVVSHYINTKLNDGKTALEATTDRFIGIGLFNYEAVQQHGDVRLNIDATSESVSSDNVTSVIFNTSFSFTDLSVKTTTNGKKNTSTTAFALYKVAEPTA